MDLLRFDDLTPIEEHVSIGGKDYVLREVDGEAAVVYDDALAACRVYENGRLIRVNNPGRLEPLLVSLTLFDGGVRVPEATVRRWPARVQRALYERSCQISGYGGAPKTLAERVADTERLLEDLRRQLVESEQVQDLSKNSPGGTVPG